MTMDIRRTFLWVVFTMSILLLWDNWMVHTGRPSMFFPSATQPAAPVAATGAPGMSDVPSVPAAAAGTTAATAAAVPNGAAPVQSELITITTDVLKAQIDTQGGEFKYLELLQHKDTNDPTKNLVLFDASPARTYLAQTGLIGASPAGAALPNHRSAFVPQAGSRTLESGNQVQLVLAAEQDGVKLIKTYTFTRGEYAIDIRHDVVNTSGAPIAPSLYMQLVRDGTTGENESMFYSTFTGPAVYSSIEHFQKVDFDTIAKGKIDHVTKANDGWIAMVQHYFVSAFLPPANTHRDFFTKKVDNNLYAVGAIVSMGSIAPGATGTMSTPLFAGPQESARLDDFAEGFDLVKDYGWLTVIAKPIFWLMDQIHKVLGNWGWTIIALTVLIKLAFFPLTAASYRSMAKMKGVTPKMTAIRERHKGDPQKMNQAMMELYKTEKINPIGGCLPIVVQMPVFIALYWVLLASVEMRHAPWLGWIQDLASPDPWYILPVVMAISMFIQTKLNPKPPDPMQAKIMMWMPVVFSVMFFFFPAGLVLYWVVNNILSIAQQWLINKKMNVA